MTNEEIRQISKAKAMEQYKENYARRIGTEFGDYRVIDCYYDFEIGQQRWEIVCKNCGTQLSRVQTESKG